jgi:hypothetical protein
MKKMVAVKTEDLGSNSAKASGMISFNNIVPILKIESLLVHMYIDRNVQI